MRRPVRVASHNLEQLRRRARRINRILSRLQAVEPELALLVGLELAAQVVARLVLGVEDVVLAVGASLPHVEDGVGDAEAGVDVLDDAVEKGDLAVLGHVLDDAVAECAEGSLGGPEGAENCGGSGLEALVGYDLVVDFVDKTDCSNFYQQSNLQKGRKKLGIVNSRLNSQNIAHSPRLVAVLAVCTANGVDVVDTDNPLILCQLDLAAEVVHVLDQRGENLAVARLRLCAHQVDDVLCEVGVEAAGSAVGGSGAVGMAVCCAVGRHCGFLCDLVGEG